MMGWVKIKTPQGTTDFSIWLQLTISLFPQHVRYAAQVLHYIHMHMVFSGFILGFFRFPLGSRVNFRVFLRIFLAFV